MQELYYNLADTIMKELVKSIAWLGSDHSFMCLLTFLFIYLTNFCQASMILLLNVRNTKINFWISTIYSLNTPLANARHDCKALPQNPVPILHFHLPQIITCNRENRAAPAFIWNFSPRIDLTDGEQRYWIWGADMELPGPTQGGEETGLHLGRTWQYWGNTFYCQSPSYLLHGVG